MVRYFQLLILFAFFFTSIECAKLLSIFHIPARSHYTAGSTLMKILAEKGHDVTVVSPFSEKNPPKNYKEVFLKGLYEEVKDEKFNMFELYKNPLAFMIFLNYMSTRMIEKTFNHTNFRKLMNSEEKFDAVIIEAFNSEAMKYVAHHFKAPLVAYSALDANEWTNPYQGNPDSPSYTPNIFLPFSTDMTFLERASNSIFYATSYLVKNIFVLPMQNRMLHKYYPDAPHMNEFIYNVSLVLLNSDPSVYDILPRVPSMVDIGGFHVKKPKSLPEDLQKLMDRAKQGVIYFSMGSNLQSKDIPEEKRNLLLRTFSKLKQTVLWKFEEDLPKKPENVITRKWFPQNDILAHKNMKIFITHGGIFSTIEAVYHGVPLLALGVLAEQILNSERAEKNGYAKSIPFDKIEEDTFVSYLNELLGNPKYKENAEKRSRILKDKPLSATEAVNYWVEYIVRHKGAPHLRVASLNLNWYQYILLDVVAFVLVIISIFIYTLKYAFKVIFRRKLIKKEKIT